MRNIYILLIYIFAYTLYHGQTQSQNTIGIMPVPSVASLATYNNIPVSVQTGVPDISYSLFEVSTNNKFVSVNLQLSYHTGNVSKEMWSGEVGTGWALLGQGVISREVLGDFDESFDNSSAFYYIKNEFDDIYNFSIPGETGKFRVLRNKGSDVFEIIKLSPFNSKLEYTRTSNTSTLIFDSFTVTNDKGIKYKFQNYDLSTMRVWMYDHPLEGSMYADRNYRSAFYLNSILDENNQELVKYSYLKDTKYVPGTSNLVIESETNKVSKIEIKDRGIIELNYDKNESVDKKTDRFSINNIVLKNINNQFIKRYKFDYDYSPNRRLRAFKQVDAAENEIEKYTFNYQLVSSPISEGDQESLEVLKNVKLPTAGMVEYNFDLVRSYYTDITKTYTSPPVELATVSFDQFNASTKKYYFTLTQNKEIMINIPSQLLSGFWSLNFFKKEGNTYKMLPFTLDVNSQSMEKRIYPPGEYYVSLENSDPSAPFNGPINFKALYYDQDPIETVNLIAGKARLLRIRSIKYFNEESVGLVAARMEEYNYNKFDDPSITSGYYTEMGSNSDLKPVNPIAVYKNVKVTNGNGYTKYYFKAADAYPSQPTADHDRAYWPYFNIMRSGLIEKKEIYNSLNQKITEDVFEYTINDDASPTYLSIPTWMGGNFYMNTSWIKNQKINSKTFFNNGISESQSETVRNMSNYKINLEKLISFDGTIEETTYQYALDKNNQKLIGANMIGIPLEITSVIKKTPSDTGKIMSKSETKYDNVANKFPSSIISYDTQNILASETIFNQYDIKGNLQQYTTKDGIPVSIVWGYNKTLPIAKIEGATYSQITSYVADIIAKSDADKDDVSEQNLQNALSLFRNNSNLRNYQITTYVYDPLIGMKSMTPPSGIREIYKYDSANRLDQVIDENGKVLKKYRYNYKH
ncbi:hypothetical protein [Chryseobacterium sp. LAM-KRS1]|uniref:hypothetical protein n=1 Tax=Chryseobacterium sp. LAM-KRS1 TaxID=2715754 RepID=UPI00155616DD|nr:hypothetical protein [Chryseobacterium sp. LAM-KRS1]